MSNPLTVEVKDRLKRKRREQHRQQRVTPIGDGPGVELIQILRQLGAPDCERCKEYARQMNGWGAEGCKERRNEIIGHLEDERQQLTWWNQMLMAGLAIRHGLPLTTGGLVDEAITRAETKATEKKNRRGKDAAGRRLINLPGRGSGRGRGGAITWAWLAEGASEPLTFAATGGVRVMLELLGQRTVQEQEGGLEVNECYRRETREGCRRPRIEVWAEVLGIQTTPKRLPLALSASPVM